nr:oligosaccharide flippase family protein [Vibrio sp. 2-2(8)]
MIRNTIIYVFLDVLSKASALIILPLVTKSLSVESYGSYKFIMEFSIFVVMISTLGIGSSIARYNFDKLNIKRVYTLGYATSLISIPISLILLAFINYKHNISFSIGFMFTAISFLTMFNSYSRQFFTINKKIKEFSIIKVVELVVFFLSIVAFYYFGMLNIYSLLFSMLMMVTANTVLSLSYASEIINFDYAGSFISVFSKIRKFSIDSYISGVVKYLNLNLEKIFFAFYLTGTGFGIYALAVTIGTVVRTVGVALFLSFAPTYYENHRQGDCVGNQRIFKSLFFLAPILYFVFIILVELGWKYIIDGEYYESKKYVSVISLIYTLEIYYGLTQYYWFQIKNTEFLLKYEVLFFTLYSLCLGSIFVVNTLDLMSILYFIASLTTSKIFILVFYNKDHELRKISSWMLGSIFFMVCILEITNQGV